MQLVLENGGYCAFQAHQVREGLESQTLEEIPLISSSFENLVRDDQMGDGGRYRFRRFSRFRAQRLEGKLEIESIEGRSILQSTEDNPLNGGVLRTFQPLEEKVADSTLLRGLLFHDIRVLESLEPEFFLRPVTIGVHQVRIVASGTVPGKPTPEGIHRDAERYTFQHFWRRQGISGGHFVAYDDQKSQVFRWLQTETLDSVLFTGSTWHSATPIACTDAGKVGFRDIFLIDFDQ